MSNARFAVFLFAGRRGGARAGPAKPTRKRVYSANILFYGSILRAGAMRGLLELLLVVLGHFRCVVVAKF